ncbi:hypothetical protein [Nocardioides sp.]|uniref:hypothetical protein n=1 Tax=Nocardioides sp. TaxID=35761 RepID=UPI00271F56FF|nr:hypothetical protein [Nocardioides sp.]MDO9456518.1 hypothetical protein [Nocardioides sp.]
MTKLPLLTLLAALAWGATACSDDTEPSADPTSSTTTSEPTPEPTTEPTTSEPTTTELVPTEPTSTATETPTPAPDPTPTLPPTPTQPPVDPDAAPTTYAAAQARFDAKGQEPREVVRFRTVTGTYCLLDSDFAIGCELPRGGIPDPDYCGDGPSQNVGRVVFGAGDPTPECNSDTIREPGAPRVENDTVATSTATGIQCLVEAIGVTCLDPARTQGFFLGPDDYTVFTAG